MYSALRILLEQSGTVGRESPLPDSVANFLISGCSYRVSMLCNEDTVSSEVVSLYSELIGGGKGVVSSISEAVCLDVVDRRTAKHAVDLAFAIHEAKKGNKEDDDDSDEEEAGDLDPDTALDSFLGDLEKMGVILEAAGKVSGLDVPGVPDGDSLPAWKKLSSNAKEVIMSIASFARERKPVRIRYSTKVTTGKPVYRTIYPYSLRTRQIHVNGYGAPKVNTPVLFGYDPFKGTIKMFVIDRIRTVLARPGQYTPKWDVEFH
jgi:hypothetical protein